MFLVFGAVLLSLTTTPPLPGQARVVMAVRHFDSDGVADTLLGTRSAGGCFLPYSIRWGDTGSLTVTETLFSYPAWTDLSGSGAVSDLNGDTLSDIVFFIKGQTGSPLHDTSRVFVIAGGASLDLAASVNIATLPATQTSPFHAQNLTEGIHFMHGGVRDLTGHKSWFLSLTFPPQPLATHVAELPAWTVRLYPNPATGTETQMEGRNVSPGIYTVSIHSLQGRTLLEQTIEVDGSGEFLRTLDLHALATGTYTVRLAGVNTPGVFTYSLVLIR